jgi:hypothetical protein
MSTPTVFPSSVGRYVDVRPGAPTVNITTGAASWRGNSLAPLRTFPTLAGQSFAAPGSGRFGVVDARVGPRVGSARGTIDTWFKMGSGADSVVIAQSAYSTTSAPLITLGVNASGQAVGSIHSATGATVAAWAATTMASNAPGALVHLTVAWDATRPINGLHHVSVVVNGVALPVTGFTTAPLAPWPSFQPIYLATGAVTETSFDGEMIITQASPSVSL